VGSTMGVGQTATTLERFGRTAIAFRGFPPKCGTTGARFERFNTIAVLRADGNRSRPSAVFRETGPRSLPHFGYTSAQSGPTHARAKLDRRRCGRANRHEQ
jgi:hypothetical protein